jgi:predicted DNA-binding protein (UPF0251 family)
MPRRTPRRIRFTPGVTYFKPQGVPLRDLAEVALAPDELEAIRLHDLEHLSQLESASKMQISQPTFARTLQAAHHKIAQGIIHGQAIRLSILS